MQWPGSVGFPVWWRSRVFSSLAYLVVRRLFELMMLCCRSPRSKGLEILVLRHELSILRRHPQRRQSARGGPAVLGCVESGAAASGLVGFSRSVRERCFAGTSAGGAPLDIPASPARTSTYRSRSRGSRRPPRAGEPSLGLPADRR